MKESERELGTCTFTVSEPADGDSGYVVHVMTSEGALLWEDACVGDCSYPASHSWESI